MRINKRVFKLTNEPSKLPIMIRIYVMSVAMHDVKKWYWRKEEYSKDKEKKPADIIMYSPYYEISNIEC